MDTLPLMAVIRHLTVTIEDLTKKVDDLGTQIESMQEEWRTEFSVNGDDEEEDLWEEWFEEESESEDESEDGYQSAPATFSYKVQRTE